MSEKSYGPVSLTMGHLSLYCDLSNYAIFFMPPCRRQIFRSIEILHMLTSYFILRYLPNSKLYVTTKFNENKSFDSLAMLEDAINYQLMNQ